MQQAYEREFTALDKALGMVRDAMSRDITVLEPRTKASVAARLLEERRISGAPVVEHGRLIGIFTLRDLMEPAGPTWQTSGPFLRHEHTLADIEVGQMMTREVITGDPDWPLTRAATVMEATGVNRLPIVDAMDRVLGMLTRDDVVRAVAKRAELAQHPRFSEEFEG